LRIPGILWIGIAIVQLIGIYVAIADIWKIISGISRIQVAKRIGTMWTGADPMSLTMRPH